MGASQSTGPHNNLPFAEPEHSSPPRELSSPRKFYGEEGSRQRVCVLRTREDYAPFLENHSGNSVVAKMVMAIALPFKSPHVYQRGAVRAPHSFIVYGRTGNKKLSMLLFTLCGSRFRTVLVGPTNCHLFKEALVAQMEENENQPIEERQPIAVVFNKVSLREEMGSTERQLMEILLEIRDGALNVFVFICMDQMPRSSFLTPRIMEMCDQEIFADTPSEMDRVEYLKKITRRMHETMKKGAEDMQHGCAIEVDLSKCVDDGDLFRKLGAHSAGMSYEELEHFLSSVVHEMYKKEFERRLMEGEKNKTVVSIEPGDLLDHTCDRMAGVGGAPRFSLTNIPVEGQDEQFKDYYKKSRSQFEGVEGRREARLRKERREKEDMEALRRAETALEASLDKPPKRIAKPPGKKRATRTRKVRRSARLS